MQHLIGQLKKYNRLFYKKKIKLNHKNLEEQPLNVTTLQTLQKEQKTFHYFFSFNIQGLEIKKKFILQSRKCH